MYEKMNERERLKKQVSKNLKAVERIFNPDSRLINLETRILQHASEANAKKNSISIEKLTCSRFSWTQIRNTMKKLEDHGWIHVSRSPINANYLTVEITKQGKNQLTARERYDHRANREQLLKKLTNEELKQLQELLMKMMKEEMKNDDKTNWAE